MRNYRHGIWKPGRWAITQLLCPLPSWLDLRLSGGVSGTHYPQSSRKTSETIYTYPNPLQAPAVTAVPLATLGALGQEETPEGVHAGPASATTILIPVILLPVTPTVGTASAVYTTAMALAVPTAGLASTAVPCAQGAAGMSVEWAWQWGLGGAGKEAEETQAEG